MLKFCFTKWEGGGGLEKKNSGFLVAKSRKKKIIKSPDSILSCKYVA
jgi:hypothetical protein